MPGMSYGDAVGGLTTSINAPTQLAGQVSQLAPLATTMHGATPAAPLPNMNAPARNTGALAGFGNFLGSMVSEVGHLAVGAGKWLATNTVNLAEAPFKLGADIGHGLVDRTDITSIQAQNYQFSSRLATLTAMYKAGTISSKDYSLQLKDLNQSQSFLDKQANDLNTRVKGDQQATTVQAWNTAASLVTILTAGVGAAGGDSGFGAAAKFLTSDAADAPLLQGAAKLNEIATNPELFKGLSVANRQALQRSVAEVVTANTGRMTAAQISRASVTNLALKYPIYYNMLSSTGQQIYKELDQAKYGDAVRTVAFNALLLLSGGPIGHALKYGGEVAKGVMNATFGQTAFIDELSKGIGDGNAQKLYDVINNIGTDKNTLDTSKMLFYDDKGNFQKLTDDQIKSRLINNFSALEKTNLAATGKSEPVAAAWRVLNGMAGYEGASMSTFTHEEAVQNMSTFAEAQRFVSARGKALGLGDLTVGRVDARQLTDISKQLAAGDTTDEKLAIWEKIKTDNPGYAYANSDTLDKQVQTAIKNGKDVAGIDASFQVKGFGEIESRNLSKAGYVAIAPKNIEAPFKEGEGKIASQFAENGPLWTKAVTPIGPMAHIGDMLTGMGLSPNASAQRGYQLYNANLAENLNELNIGSVDGKLADVVKTEVAPAKEAVGNMSAPDVQNLRAQGFDDKTISKMVSTGADETGPTVEEAVKTTSKPAESQSRSDLINKILTDYKNNPTRGRLAKSLPITDYRQMTNSDIVAAFKNKGMEITSADARRIGQSIDQAWLQVPLATRGLGDKLVDANYKFNPLAGRYARLQSSLRFAWNPFYQNLRAIPKTEILASSKGGGYINSIFAGEYSQINPIRELLRGKGIFDEKGGLGTAIAGAEGVEATGDVGRNLARKLLPQQERSIAGLVVTKAAKMGLSTPTYVEQFPNEVRDMVQAIAEYDRNSNFLNSPMARTLNLAIFPFRFEVKVGTAMVKAMANTSAITQVALIKGVMNAHTWLNSPEGQAWYSHNSEAIGLFEYMTPLKTVSEVGAALGLQHNAIGQYGELGGLPFGFIPQILDAEGLTHFNQPGVDAKSGQVIPNYVPTDAKGQAETAIQDFLGSLFTYPGATIGAPSKASLTRMAAMGVTSATKTKDLKLVTPTNLSAQQQNYSQAIQKLNGTNQTGTPQVPPPTSQAVPTLPTSATTPPDLKSKTTSTKKLKKSQFTPALLPGQTALGQL